MGVSGSGKTTIGEAISARTGVTFADADDYHPAANKQKMAAGHPLNDDDRQPWLETLNRMLKSWFDSGSGGILACSALKARYRETLTAGMPAGAVHFVLLEGSRELISERLQARHHEFMNPQLLESQFATLEAPADDDPDAFKIVNDRSPDVIAGEILKHVAPGQSY
jgi:gluconokinase